VSLLRLGLWMQCEVEEFDVNDDQARSALWAYRAMIRVARHPENEPGYGVIMEQLRQAEAYYRGLPYLSLDQQAVHLTIRKALKCD